MSWRAWPFGKAPPAPDAPHALLTDIEKQGRQYLDEADNGKWVYPACKRTASDAGADRRKFSGTLNHFRRVAMSAQKWWEMKGA